jgi:hypothetical protein
MYPTHWDLSLVCVCVCVWVRVWEIHSAILQLVAPVSSAILYRQIEF